MKRENNTNKYYSSKAYRIYPLYHKLFNSCITIVNRDNLSDYLIRKYYNFNHVPKFINENNGKLLEVMVDQAYKETRSIEELKHSLNSPRIVHLKEYYLYKGININLPRIPLMVRVSDDVDFRIKQFSNKNNTIGQVVEIIIAYYISKIKSDFFDLITFTIQNEANKSEF